MGENGGTFLSYRQRSGLHSARITAEQVVITGQVCGHILNPCPCKTEIKGLGQNQTNILISEKFWRTKQMSYHCAQEETRPVSTVRHHGQMLLFGLWGDVRRVCLKRRNMCLLKKKFRCGFVMKLTVTESERKRQRSAREGEGEGRRNVKLLHLTQNGFPLFDSL